MRVYQDALITLCLALTFRPAQTQTSTGGLAERFYLAIRNNDVAELKNLAKTSGVNVKDERGATPLMYAAAFGNTEELKLLLDAGADANAKNAFDATALIWFAGDPEKSRILISHGADVNAQSKQGRTPLLMAARRGGSARLVSELLARGADPSANDSLGDTVLHLAAQAGDPETMRLLIAKGVGIDIRNSAFGMTPLGDAARSNNVEAVRLLLAHGAGINMVTTGQMRVKNGLITFGKETPLMLAAGFGSAQMIGTMLEAGAEVNAKDVSGMTPLMLAVGSETQDLRVVRLLLNAGSEVNAISATGETALDWAEKFGNASVIGALREAGARTGVPYSPPGPPQKADQAGARERLDKSIRLLQASSREFFRKSGCVSCHHQTMTTMALAAAKAARIGIDESIAKEMVSMTTSQAARNREQILQGLDHGVPDIILTEIETLAAAGYAADNLTDSIVVDLASLQRPDGSWRAATGMSRAPIEADNDISRTARVAHMLGTYAMPARQAEFEDRIARARAWLLAAKPKTNDDFAMLLVGLSWTGTPRPKVRSAANALMAQQRSDGGWGGNPNLPSDAFATGEALYALRESGAVTPADAVHDRGVQYLLRTQYPDGSWYVRSRAVKAQPYFESGFPFGHDQWISAAATAYASMAIAASIKSPVE